MKKTFSLLLISFFGFCLQANSQVTVEAIPLNPQSGQYNYFAVRGTLAQISSYNAIVEGYIQGDDNTTQPFTLTIPAGDLSVETAFNFFQTCPACGATAELGSYTANYAGVTITYEINGCILKFNSYADVLAVINQLNADDDAYNNGYDSQYSNLTEEELDEMDEQNGFDELQKFKDFENLFGGFCSKRAEIEAIENAWLTNNFTGTDPDDIDLTFDEAMNTIFNSNYSFKIGADTYQKTSSGFYKNGVLLDGSGGGSRILNKKINIIFASSNNAFSQVLNSGSLKSGSYLELSDKMFMNSSLENKILPTPCKSNKSSRESAIFDNNTRKIFSKIVINSLWFVSNVRCVAKSYKKVNGNWKKKRTKLAVGSGGTIYEGDCNGSFQYNARKPYTGFDKRKRLSVPYSSQAQVPGTETNWKTYSGLIAGSVDAPDLNFADTITLTF